MTKHAVVGLSTSLRGEVAQFGVPAAHNLRMRMRVLSASARRVACGRARGTGGAIRVVGAW